MIFNVKYERTDEAGNDYKRKCPPDLFKDLYPGFPPAFAALAQPGDILIMSLGSEKWAVTVVD